MHHPTIYALTRLKSRLIAQAYGRLQADDATGASALMEQIRGVDLAIAEAGQVDA